MRSCRTCGRDLEEEAAFCARCGTPAGAVSGGTPEDATRLRTPSTQEDPLARFAVDFEGVTLLGIYRVGTKLAEGGMGTAYLGENTNLGRPVVVKVPHARLLGEESFRERFAREIGELVRLEHPHIVRILAQGEHDGVPYFVLQHLGGGSLSKALRSSSGRRQSVEEVKRWLDPIGETLDFVHARGVIHRDVKPGNILFDEHGHVYLSDFGIAKALEGEGGGLTTTGMGMGSPYYMAPEQAMGRDLTPSADQYALAATAYEALCGRPPFDQGTPMEILFEKEQRPPPSLAGRVESLGPAAARALDRALSRRPEERFPSCRAFVEAFGGSVPAERTAAPRPARIREPAPATPREARRRGAGPWLLAILVALCATVGVLAALGVGFSLPAWLGGEAAASRSNRLRRVRTDPRTAAAWRDLGETLQREADDEGARGCRLVAHLLQPSASAFRQGPGPVAAVTRALDLVGNLDARFLGRLGEAAALEGRAWHELAGVLYERARNLDPSSAAWARAVLEYVDLPAAAGTARRRLRDPAAWRALGEVHGRLDQDERARGCEGVARLLEGAAEPSGAAADVVSLLEAHGIEDGPWMETLGDAAAGAAWYGVAEDLYRRALSVGPGSEALRRKVEQCARQAAVLDNVRRAPSNDEHWGDLGDLWRETRGPEPALGCWTIARLLQPEDSEWQGKAPRPAHAAAVLRDLGWTNDEWVGDLADSARGLGFGDVAAELYALALELDPSDSEWRRHAAQQTRMERLVAAVRSEPRSADAWGDLGDAHQAAGRAETARGCWTIARLLRPQDAEWVGKAAPPAHAVAVLRDLGWTNDEWVGDLGDSARALGFANLAADLYGFARELDPDDAEWTRKAEDLSRFERLAASVRSDPRNDEAWGNLGDAHQAAGRTEAARGCWTVAHLLDPGDSEWSGKDLSPSLAGDLVEQMGLQNDEWIGDLGDAARSRGWLALARRLYALALSIDAADSEWPGKVAQMDAVERDLGLVVAEPLNDERWGDLGDALHAAGLTDHARACWTAALILDPDDAEWIGKTHNPSTVVTVVRELALDDEPVGDLADAALARGWLNVARDLYALALELDASDSEWQRKAPASERAVGAWASVREDLRNDERWGDLGDVLSEAGQTTVAGGCWTLARLLDPDDSEWQRKSNWSGAVEALRALRITDDELVGDLGDAAGTQHRHTLARALYRLALSLDPDDSEWQRKANQ